MQKKKTYFICIFFLSAFSFLFFATTLVAENGEAPTYRATCRYSSGSWLSEHDGSQEGEQCPCCSRYYCYHYGYCPICQYLYLKYNKYNLNDYPFYYNDYSPFNPNID